MTEEEKFARCFVEFLMSRERIETNRERTKSIAGLVAESPDITFRLMVDMKYDASDDKKPFLTIYQIMISAITESL